MAQDVKAAIDTAFKVQCMQLNRGLDFGENGAIQPAQGKAPHGVQVIEVGLGEFAHHKFPVRRPLVQYWLIASLEIRE